MYLNELAHGMRLASLGSDSSIDSLPLYASQAMTTKLKLGAVTVLLLLGGCSRGVVVGSPSPAVGERSAREVIVVEETHVPRGHAYGWWKNHGYRQVTVYSDGTRFYPRRLVRHPELKAIVVYEREGRYYRWADEDKGGKDNGPKRRGKD